MAASEIMPVDLNSLPTAQESERVSVKSVHHIEIYCGNARQSSFFYQKAFGFKPIAYRGPETGHRDCATYVLAQGAIVLALTAPLRPNHQIAEQLSQHGDTVHSVCFEVLNLANFCKAAVSAGASFFEEPQEKKDQFGAIRQASIRAFGDVIHELVEMRDYKGPFLPGFLPYEDFHQSAGSTNDAGLKSIDHVVGNVELGKLDSWTEFYKKFFRLIETQKFTDKDISTEYSALMSRVLSSESGSVKFPIIEPAVGRRKSQIEEYLDFHSGPGVQHIAFATDDIISTVSTLRSQGIEFLSVPSSYYEEAAARLGEVPPSFDLIRETGILVDRDNDGLLFQQFTKPVQDRPTLFFEIIQRVGSNGFGAGNFKALFEAIEREQMKRGNC